VDGNDAWSLECSLVYGISFSRHATAAVDLQGGAEVGGWDSLLVAERSFNTWPTLAAFELICVWLNNCCSVLQRESLKGE
jgi:hypothetical protein